jgi:hypothetical protein
MMKRHFLEPTIAGPAPIDFPGADEAALLMLKHKANGEQPPVFQVQHYLRAGKWIGIATLTTYERAILEIRPDFDRFMKVVRIARD